MNFVLRKRPLWLRAVRLPLTFARVLRVTPLHPLLCWRLAWLTVR